MNGAIAELCARINVTPNNKSTKIMGSSHHLLLAIKNETNSPAIPKRLRVTWINVMVSLPLVRESIPQVLGRHGPILGVAEWYQAPSCPLLAFLINRRISGLR
jgi:hypothetical protein